MIAVGSTNPLKIKVVEKLFPLEKVVGVEVEVSVPPTPMSVEEMVRGAKERALGALRKAQASLGVGLEGGLYSSQEGWFLTAFAAITDGKHWGVGHGFGLSFPEGWVKELKDKELGTLMDEITGKKGMKQSEGAAGVLTGGLIERGKMLCTALRAALGLFRASRQTRP